MLDHVKAQTLLAAHGAEVRLRQDIERMPLAQPMPTEPTAEEAATHSLTHEPFKPWCALCTQYRSRQDPHPVSDHERVGRKLSFHDRALKPSKKEIFSEKIFQPSKNHFLFHMQKENFQCRKFLVSSCAVNIN